MKLWSDAQLASIHKMLNPKSLAIVGATPRLQYGGRMLAAALNASDRLRVYPVNPRADEVEGLESYADLAALPRPVRAISIVTPPSITERVVEQAAELGIRHIWMQPGAESDKAVGRAERAGMNVIAGGACALVVQGYHES